MRIYIIDLESVETRYTCQWKTGLPKIILKHAREINRRAGILWNVDPDKHHPQPQDNDEVLIIPIEGEQISANTTEGAFLDFAATNVYKSTQIAKISKLFSKGAVEKGDKILVTDAWNPGVIQLRYMRDLLGIEVEIHAIWHAGNYDPQDFLGRTIKDNRWANNFERSLYHAIDYNYFATDFHIDIFWNGLLPENETDFEVVDGKINETYSEKEHKIVRSGQPHNKLITDLVPYATDISEKKNRILFPHRVAPEKQPDIFRDLAELLPEYEFVICQEQNLTKDEYHKLLAESKMVFSANLQETLGISAMEAILVNTFPLLPARLSYKEMYDPFFFYPSEWTEDYWAYIYSFREPLANKIKQVITNMDKQPEQFQANIMVQKQRLMSDYLHPGPMLEHLLEK